MTEPIWIEEEGDGPLMAVAIHAGHEVRGELFPLLAVDDAVRSREEDAYTDYWAKVAPTWLVPTRSRFETDLNRERTESIYTSPELAWGHRVWTGQPDEAAIERSLGEWDAFYRELGRLLDRLAAQFDRFVVLDLHAYNHRRAGADAEPADPQANPEVNVGTGTLDSELCGPLVERFIRDLRNFDFGDHHLDVRENVKFRGRYLAQWVHERYPGQACVLSIEFKKFFMDEWTGVGDIELIQTIRDALQSTVPGLLEELSRQPESSGHRPEARPRREEANG